MSTKKSAVDTPEYTTSKPSIFNWKNIKAVMHFITSVIMYSVFALLVIVGIIMLMYVVDMKKNSSSGVYKPPIFNAYVIISNSMVPTIQVEDAVIIKRTTPGDLKVGDIITFISTDPRYNGTTVTHRIVGIYTASDGTLQFRTKGDNNNVEDSTLVRSDKVLGKVLFKIPKIGYIQWFLSQSYGWIIAVVIPCLGIVIYDIIKLIKNVLGYTKSKKKEKEGTQKLLKTSRGGKDKS